MGEPIDYSSEDNYWKSIKKMELTNTSKNFLTPSGVSIPTNLDWGASRNSSAYLAGQTQYPGDYAAFNAGGNGVTGAAYGGQPPSAFGGLFDTKGIGGMALGAINTGVGAFNAWMGMKNQKFLENYYSGQQALQLADYKNNVRSSNQALESNQRTFLDSQGINTTTDKGKEQLDSYMQKWGAK